MVGVWLAMNGGLSGCIGWREMIGERGCRKQIFGISVRAKMGNLGLPCRG